MTFSTWLIVLFLILVNALYVAAEFSTVSVRRTQIQQMAERGHALARRLLPFLEDSTKLDRYIAACQIGITLSSLILGAYSQATLAVELANLLTRWGGLSPLAAQSTASMAVLIGITALQVVIGELVPKSLALQFPAQVALATVWPMRWSLTLYTYTGFLPALNGSGIAFLRLLGIPYSPHRHLHRPEEIDLLIEESRNGGLLDPREQRRLQRALRLGTRLVRHLMTPRVYMHALNVNASPEEVHRAIMASPYTRLPVYRDTVDHVVGQVNVKDVVSHYLKHGRLPAIRDVMRAVEVVPETSAADDLLRVFRERRTQQVVVLDEFGGTSGLVTMEDVLAEVLDDMSEKFRVAGQPEPERLPDGRVRLPGLMHVDDAEPWIGTRWQGRATTVGGHVLQVLNRMPKQGDRLTVDGVDVEIEQVRNHAIWSVLVTPVSRAEENEKA
ncbi:hemolysin family protein [Thermaerobacter subterraneus]|uniref:CBS domain-containing protein n=1 Tax=Thermaerobacter subterraneus DSM 13965 TaxID=867903 RepID=K6P2J0_9FIRM|nr:hemolysin family protein [Thermaerobacter subterraneus]EKP95285.1 CBS domain-containing protein [Thermaerobacter subterraneus DSM 13965]